jgi:DNA-binding CsgD family transcriptional regulator
MNTSSPQLPAGPGGPGGPNWFDVDRRPCFVLTRGGEVLAHNPAAASLIEQGVVSIRAGALTFGRPDADGALMEALEAVAQEGGLHSHVMVRDHVGLWRHLTLHHAPGEESVIFVSIRSQLLNGELTISVLVDGFGLTPAQAKVVVHLASGLSPKEIGRRMDISTDTVRTHLRAIYRKLRVRGIPGALRLVAQLLD